MRFLKEDLIIKKIVHIEFEKLKKKSKINKIQKDKTNN